MCKFLSGIVFQTGELSTSQYTDSHESLIKWLNLDDSAPIQTRTWIRVEFAPEDKVDYDKLNKYVFKVDEHQTPIWFNDEMREHIIQEMTKIIKASIVDSDKKILLGGKWILTGKCKIESVENSIIVWMGGSSSVKVMRGSSSVNEMWGSSSVKVMRGSSSVNEMWGSSSVKEMRESSSVNEMWGSSSVNEMRESSSVNEMWGSSSVNEMRESSSVNEMRESSSVNEMWGSSSITKDNRIKKS